MGQSAAGAQRRIGPARERLLVCLDLQRISAPGEGADPCVVNCRRVLAHARRSGWPVVHVRSRAAGRAGRPIEGVGPLAGEALVYRSGVSAFSSRAFRRLAAGRELVIIGQSMSSSCLATAMVAYDNDLPVIVVEDAVSSTPIDAAMREALDVVSRQIAGSFVSLTSTASLLGQTRLLRAV